MEALTFILALLSHGLQGTCINFVSSFKRQTD